MIVGVCCQLDWRRPQPLVDAALARRLRRIAAAAPELTLVGVHWCSIDDDGGVDVSHPVGTARSRMALHDIDLLHFCRLGTVAGTFDTLQDKWRRLRDKLEIVDARQIRCCNSTAALRWGIDKAYMEVLAAKGVRIPPTKRISSSVTLAQLHAACGDTFHVVKPANGECGRFVTLISQLTRRGLERLRRESPELLLQPFVGEALAGEKSFIFMGGGFSHAVMKIAGPSDFRTNGKHTGATIYAYRPDACEIMAAQDLAGAFPCPLDSYRIDLVGTPGKEIVMEIEVVDPGHFPWMESAYVANQTSFYQRMLKRS